MIRQPSAQEMQHAYQMAHGLQSLKIRQPSAEEMQHAYSQAHGLQRLFIKDMSAEQIQGHIEGTGFPILARF